MYASSSSVNPTPLANADTQRDVHPRLLHCWTDCPTVPLKEFVSVDDDNVCTTPIVADKDILEFDQSSKNIIDADSDDKKEMNNAAPVPPSSEMRNTMKSTRYYSDAHSNGKMNNKMADIEQLVVSLMLKKDNNAKKNTRLFPKNSINVLF
ncbi:hypothetical protein TNCV_3330171 [Trichonephila clavipes]|nr:hypothetical protein TNCV_3330171 [Trichonephila clavipes]